jgi:DnaJ-domain-containing protein 1
MRVVRWLRTCEAELAKNDPFGFDLSVSAAKKKNPRGRRGMTGAFETSVRVCDHPGCREDGKYRAPKSPDTLDDFFWFCRDHVREYNLKWNFFVNATEQEFLDQVEKDRVWERPTKPFGKRSEEQRAWARLGVDDPHQVLGGNATRNPKGPAGGGRKLPPTERRAVEILAVRDTQSKAEIRKAYKALIKVLHPDMNGGDRSQEEQLAEVVWAWEQIRVSRNFRDET